MEKRSFVIIYEKSKGIYSVKYAGMQLNDGKKARKYAKEKGYFIKEWKASESAEGFDFSEKTKKEIKDFRRLLDWHNELSHYWYGKYALYSFSLEYCGRIADMQEKYFPAPVDEVPFWEE